MASGAIPPLVQTIVVQGANAIPQAMAQASASVSQAASQISGSSTQIKASIASQTQAFVAAKLNAQQLGQQFAALQGSSTATAQQIHTVGAALQAAQSQAASAGQQLQVLQLQLRLLKTMGEDFNSTDARVGVQAGLREMGVTGNRALSRLIAQSSTLGPIFAAAFPVIGAIAAVQVISMMIDKIKEVSEEMAGWDKRAQKTYEDMAQASRAAIDQQRELAKAMREVQEVGLGGTGKASLVVKNQAADTKDWANAAAEAQHQLNRLNAEAKIFSKTEMLTSATSGGVGGVAGALTQFASNEAPSRRAKDLIDKDIDAWQKKLDEANAKLVMAPAGAAHAAAELALAAREQAVAIFNEMSRIKELALSKSENDIKTEYALGKSTLEKETADLVKAEEDRLAIKKAQIAKEGSLPGRGPLVPSQLAAAEQETANKIASIRNESRVKADSMDDAEKKATVEARKAFAVAVAHEEEELAKLTLGIKQQSFESERKQRHDQENALYNADRSALQAELELAREAGDKKKAEVIALNGKLEALEKEHNAKIYAISADIDAKITEDRKHRIEEQLRATQELSNVVLQTEKQTSDARLKLGQTTVNQWAAAEQGALNKWKTEQFAAIDAAMAKMRQFGLQDTVEYKSLTDRRIQLDHKWQQETDKVANAVAEHWHSIQSNAFNQINGAFRNALTGADTFAHGMAKVFDSLLLDAAQYFLKIEEMNALHWAIRKVQDITGWGIKAATDGAGAAAAAIAQKAGAEVQVATDAGVAAAGAAASVAWIPLVGPELAVAASSSLFAYVMALGSFEKGGIVPRDMVAQVHEGEGVFSRPTMQMLDNAASGGMGGPTTYHTTVNYHEGQNGGRGKEDVYNQVMKAMRKHNMTFGSST